MNRLFSIALMVTAFVFLIASVGVCTAADQKEQPAKTVGIQTQKSAPAPKAPMPKNEGLQTQNRVPAKKGDSDDEVAILDTSYGTMVVEFFPKDAPGHVANFKKLAREGFYDGTKFHRIIKGFMIQGGDPNTKGPNVDSYGKGGPGYTIKAEFNVRKHVKGILSMARSQDPNSAGSQFFICLAAQPALDGKYTVFGRVIKGMDVLEAIGNVKVRQGGSGENSVPVAPVLLKKVTVVPRVEFQKVTKVVPERGTKPLPDLKKVKKTGPEEGVK